MSFFSTGLVFLFSFLFSPTRWEKFGDGDLIIRGSCHHPLGRRYEVQGTFGFSLCSTYDRRRAS